MRYFKIKPELYRIYIKKQLLYRISKFVKLVLQVDSVKCKINVFLI